LAATCLAATSAHADPIVLGCRSGKALQRAIKQANTAGVAEIQLASNCVYVVSTPATATEAFETITGDVTITAARTPSSPATPARRATSASSRSHPEVRSCCATCPSRTAS
jgi:hypothetical protein